MARTAIDVRPIAGALGAEISGVDLAGEVGDETIAAIRRAWLDHCVIFFRDQDLPPARFLTFAKRFGEVDRVSLHQGPGGVSRDHPGREARAREDQLRRHLALRHLLSRDAADGAPCWSRAKCRPHGGDTMFANTYLAYETLSDGMKRMLDGLVGINSSAKADASRTREDRVKAERARRRQEGIRGRAPGRAHASRDRAARRSTSTSPTRCASRT